MNIELSKIIDFLADSLLDIKGNSPKNFAITNLRESNNVDEFTLDWISETKEKKQEIVENSKAKVILVTPDVEYNKLTKNQNKILLFVHNPKLELAKIANEFFVEKIIPTIHSSAVIHPSAIIGKHVYIGPNCVIGNCSIGNNVSIEGNNFIYDHVIIGNNVEVHAGAIIGNEAHNFVENEIGDKIKFPHIGKTIIGNNVIIGAQSVISRGVLSNTIIGNDTKIAQLVLIGANNIIGKGCSVRANVIISGSVKIGNNTIIAPSVTIRDQKTIGDNCFIGMGAVVTKDIPFGETWFGNPAKKLK